MENSLIRLLRYDILENKKNKWIHEEKLLVYDNWLPFHFAYHDLFIGLDFAPVDLGWRKLDTVQDLFELCFQLSLILWLNINGQLENPRESALKLFAIPEEFHTDDLPLQYSHRCGNEVGRVISFLPRQLPLPLYSEDDYRNLIKWYNFDLPDYHVIDIFQGMKMVGYNSFYNILIDRYNWKYHFTTLARKEGLTYDGIINRTFLEYALQVINKPPGRYLYLAENVLMTKASYTSWELNWKEWILRHLEWILLYHASIFHYIGLGFVNINTLCRRTLAQDIAPYTAKLLQLISLAPPLPVSVMVSRGLRGVQFNTLPLHKELVEDGFMSTSLVGLDPSFFSTSVYLHLKVPAGMPVIAILAVNNRQQELLFPPGTRYVLNRQEKKDNLTIFHGEIRK